LWSKTRNSDY